MSEVSFDVKRYIIHTNNMFTKKTQPVLSSWKNKNHERNLFKVNEQVNVGSVYADQLCFKVRAIFR